MDADHVSVELWDVYINGNPHNSQGKGGCSVGHFFLNRNAVFYGFLGLRLIHGADVTKKVLQKKSKIVHEEHSLVDIINDF